MNRSLPSPGVGLAAPNDPRLMSRLTQPQFMSYSNSATNSGSASSKPSSQMSTISRLVPYTATAAAATVTTLTSTAPTNAFNQAGTGGGGGGNVARYAAYKTTQPTTSASPNSNLSTTAAAAINNCNRLFSTTNDDSSEVQIIGQVKSPNRPTASTSFQSSHSPNTSLNTSDNTTMRKGSQLKIKSRPKKNQAPNVLSNQPTSGGQQQQQQAPEPQTVVPTISSQTITPTITTTTTTNKEVRAQINPLNTSQTSASISTSADASKNSNNTAKDQSFVVKPIVRIEPTVLGDCLTTRPTPLANVIRHLPAFKSTPAFKSVSTIKPQQQPAHVVTNKQQSPIKSSEPIKSTTPPLPAPLSPAKKQQQQQQQPVVSTTRPPTPPTSPARPQVAPQAASKEASPVRPTSCATNKLPIETLASLIRARKDKLAERVAILASAAPKIVTDISSNLTTTDHKIDDQMRRPSENKQKGEHHQANNMSPSANGRGPSPTKDVQPLATTPKTTQQQSPTKPSTQPSLPSAFDWDVYLNLCNGEAAPKEAFRQDTAILTNLFKLGMKLEAKDPRNEAIWCLATVYMMDGPRLRLRFDGGDNTNDFFELVNSENIRPVNSKLDEALFPPLAYKGNLSTYPKFLEKVLTKPDTVVAPPDCFVPAPKRPEKNLFKPGMKLEAVDRKNPYLICPASVGSVTGDDIKIIFDGWKGSFDYTCKYYSREIFPVNWCRDNKHYIAAPNGWEGLIGNSPPKNGKQTAKASERSSLASPKTPARPPADRVTSKEAHLAHLQLQPKPNPAASTPKSTAKATSNSSPPKSNPSFFGPPNSKVKSGKRKCSASPEPAPSSKPTLPPVVVESDQLMGDMTKEDGDDDTSMMAPMPGLSFQCQRTVPYDTWVKTSKLSKSQASDEPCNSSSSITIEDKSPTKQSIAKNDRVSVNSSDWLNNSVNQDEESVPELKAPQPDSPQPKTRGRPRKRMRLDPEVEAQQHNLPPGIYTNWSVDEVLAVIESDETIRKYSYIFENHEIDGKAFGLLTTDMMINHMSLKIGPVLKIAELIEKVKRQRRFE